MDAEVTLYFRDQLRQARATALRDAEAFDEIIFVLERLGGYLCNENCPAKKNNKGKKKNLGLAHKGEHIIKQANNSSLATEIPSKLADFHTDFEKLFRLVREARNDAMHEGAFARHLTTHAVELSIVLEDSLMKDCDKVGDYMVRNPVCAFSWQPLSFVRQTMLVNSFSYLPVLASYESEPKELISDLAVAQYLRGESDGRFFKQRLTQTLGDVLSSKAIKCCEPRVCTPDTLIIDALKYLDNLPILVKSASSKQLVGLLTAFDLL